MAHGDEAAPSDVAARFEALAHRRRVGEPLAYLVGRREFHGLDFEVGPAVLIPRADTEVLVDEALRRAPPGARVIDLGTGSGCIALTLAHEREDLHVVASDASRDALAFAHRNAQRLCAAALAAGASSSGSPTGGRRHCRANASGWRWPIPPTSPRPTRTWRSATCGTNPSRR